MDRVVKAMLNLAKAKEDDKGYLLSLRLGTMDKYLQDARLFLNEHQHQQRIEERFDDCFLIHSDGQRVGMVKYYQSPQTLVIMQLQIAPEHQNKGFGSEVLSTLRNKARGGRMSLTVLKNNPALALYLRHGFVVNGEDEFEFALTHDG